MLCCSMMPYTYESGVGRVGMPSASEAAMPKRSQTGSIPTERQQGSRTEHQRTSQGGPPAGWG